MNGSPQDPLVVLRCGSCGDTFSTHDGEDALCPTCGSADLQVASEPLL